MDRITQFSIPNSIEPKDILTRIGTIFTPVLEQEQNEEQVFYDSFDWRLYKKGLLYYRSAGSYFCTDLSGEAILGKFRSRHLPQFAEDLPSDKPWQEVGEHLWPRALIPLATLQTRVHRYAICNDDQKTVVRMYHEVSGERKKTRSRIVLHPLRGYDDEAGQIAGALKEAGLVPEQHTPLKNVFKQAGRKPGEYSSKVNVQLGDEMRGDEAARVIFARLLEVMRANRQGIIDDIDSEFLHDFRVSVRRTRSALSQLKGVLDPEMEARARQDFRYVSTLR